MNRPSFFIVGAPKCGTTSLYSYLYQHPEIFMSPVKEPFYFSPDLDVRWRYKTLDSYLSLFLAAKSTQIIGEASAVYLYSEVAAKLIKDFCPQAKIVIMLRNPIDVMYSWHKTMLYMALEDIIEFEEAINAQEDRKKGTRIPYYCEEPKVLFYFEVAKFSRQIQRYLDIFEPQNIHIVFFEDFSKDTENTYENILKFLEVDSTFKPNFKIYNKSESNIVPNLAIRSFLFQHTTFKKTIHKVIPTAWVAKGRDFLGQLTQYQPPKVMNKKLRIELNEKLNPEIEELSDILERDLSHWLI